VRKKTSIEKCPASLFNTQKNFDLVDLPTSLAFFYLLIIGSNFLLYKMCIQLWLLTHYAKYFNFRIGLLYLQFFCNAVPLVPKFDKIVRIPYLGFQPVCICTYYFKFNFFTHKYLNCLLRVIKCKQKLLLFVNCGFHFFVAIFFIPP
jgi:hypothetical protein